MITTVPRVPRAHLLCEVFRPYKEYPWVITEKPYGIFIEHSYRSYRDIYKVYGDYSETDKQFGIAFTVNTSHDKSYLGVVSSYETKEQQSKSLMRCISVSVAMIKYVLEHYPVKIITFVFLDTDTKRLILYQHLARFVAKTFHGRYTPRTDGVYIIYLDEPERG